MSTLEELQKLTAEQGFAPKSEDVELPVNLGGVKVVLGYAEAQREWVNNQPTDKLRLRDHVDEDTGEVVQQVRMSLTLKLVQYGVSAPVKLPPMWFDVDTALAFVKGAGHEVKIDSLMAVPYSQTYKKEGSSFTNERPAVRWKAEGVHLLPLQ